MAAFPIPATTFEILKGGFNSPTQAILVDALATSRLIGNDKEGFLLILMPTGTQMGLDLICLPQTNVPIKLLPRLADQIRDRTGWQETAASRPMLTSMVRTDTQERVPALFLTECDHGKAPEGTICDDRTCRFAKTPSQTLEQCFKTVPSSLIPGVLPWHHFPHQRENT